MKSIIVFDEKDVAKFLVHIARMEVLIKMGAEALKHSRDTKEFVKILEGMVKADNMKKRFTRALMRAQDQGVPTPSRELIREVRRELGEDV